MAQVSLACFLLLLSTGCQTSNPLMPQANRWFKQDINFGSVDFATAESVDSLESRDSRLERLASDRPLAIGAAAGTEPIQLAAHQPATPSIESNDVIRGQSPDDNQFAADGFSFPEGSPGLFRSEDSDSDQETPNRAAQIPTTSSDDEPAGGVRKVAYKQYPELSAQGRPAGNGLPSPDIGAPNELNPLVQPFERGGNAPLPFPMNYADLDVYVTETQTGRMNFGGAYNSDNGIVGQFTIDEKNFDLFRWPRSFRDIADGTAWRGGGQQFRLELVPGANLERYLVSLTEPYLFGTNYSLSVSGYLFDRNYFDWDEERLGGRVSIGRRLTPDLSINMALRMESVTLDNARTDASPLLNSSLGTSNLFLASAGLIRDTRDSMVAATEGSYLALTVSQAFGDYSYTRGDLDYRTYRLLYERPDGSGRHTISFGTKLGFTGSDTPIFENYYAGGFSTLRGFDFRGAAPTENGVRVGGEFQWLNTLEYMFPLTADDALKGVLFCDFGTVEESVELNSENFRVAPGFGLRVSMPGQAGGAPLAFDFAFPVSTAAGDEEQVFSFYLGVMR